MKNKQNWKPSKVILNNKGKIVPNLSKIYGGSYYIIKIQCLFYDEYIKKYFNGKVLDAGCGKVPYYELYKDLITDNICVDHFENEFMDRKIDLNEKIPFKNNEFDSVLLADVIAHIPNTNNLFSEINRILKTNGKLIVFTPFYYWINEPPNDYFRFTSFALNKYCVSNNLEPIILKSYGTKFDIIMDLLNKTFNKGVSFRLFKLFADLVFLIRMPLIIKNTEYSKNRFPLGYILVAKKL